LALANKNKHLRACNKYTVLCAKRQASRLQVTKSKADGDKAIKWDNKKMGCNCVSTEDAWKNLNRKNSQNIKLQKHINKSQWKTLTFKLKL